MTQALGRILPGDWQVQAIYLDLATRIHIVSLKHPRLSVDQVTVELDYQALRSGRLRFRSVTVQSPTGSIDLAEIGKTLPRSEGAHVPILVDRSDQDSSDATIGNQDPQLSPEDSQLADQKLIRKHAFSVQALDSEIARIPSEPMPNGFESWIVVEKANLSFKWNGTDQVQLRNLEAKIPVGGNMLRGTVTWDGLKLRSIDLMGKSSTSLYKTNGRIVLEQPQVEFMGVNVVPHMGVVRTNKGLFFMVDIEVPSQEVKTTQVSARNWKAAGRAGMLTARFQAIGPLSKPHAWRAKGIVNATDIELIESHRRHPVSFDQFTSALHLLNGTLGFSELSLLGEQLSFRGNGRCNLRGEGFGVLRIMASAQHSYWLDHQWRAVLPNGMDKQSFMQPLGAGDSYYADVHIDGKIWDPQFRLGHIQQWYSLREVLRSRPESSSK